jgi:hypothetical protein
MRANVKDKVGVVITEFWTQVYDPGCGQYHFYCDQCGIIGGTQYLHHKYNCPDGS